MIKKSKISNEKGSAHAGILVVTLLLTAVFLSTQFKITQTFPDRDPQVLGTFTDQSQTASDSAVPTQTSDNVIQKDNQLVKEVNVVEKHNLFGLITIDTGAKLYFSIGTENLVAKEQSIFAYLLSLLPFK